ncbi:MAG: MlaD family protein [Sphingobacteriaceae bacterium]|nr:MlaD family protein [Sphingobacteriaceae bacterium]
MKISNETKVGILAAVVISVLIIGYNFLRGSVIFNNDTTLYARYARVDGLAVSKPVLVNGYQIGKISNLELQPDGSILATLKIKSKFELPHNSIATLESTDLLGSKAIVMELGNSKKYALTGDTLTAKIAKNLVETMLPVQKKVEQIIDKLDVLLGNVNGILSPELQKNIDKSFSSVAGTLASLEGTSKKVDSLVGKESKKIASIFNNVEAITLNLKNNNQKINDILTNINTVADQVAAANFKQTIENANKTLGDLSAILANLKEGKGSLGLLLNDDKMYNNLNNASKNLDNLMIDLKANPKRYVHFSVFGGGKK